MPSSPDQSSEQNSPGAYYGDAQQGGRQCISGKAGTKNSKAPQPKSGTHFLSYDRRTHLGVTERASCTFLLSVSYRQESEFLSRAQTWHEKALIAVSGRIGSAVQAHRAIDPGNSTSG
jgi:hypothetical protein